MQLPVLFSDSKMASVWPLFLAFLLYVSCGWAMTPTRYMLSYCKQNRDPVLELNDSVILELSNNVVRSRNQASYEHCNLHIRTAPKKHVLLQFLELRITDTRGTPDRLQIFNNISDKKTVLLTPPHGAYGIYPGERSRGVRDYNSSFNELRLNYFGRPTVDSPGFKLLLTPFKRELSGRKCAAGYFHCSISRICIRSRLSCDGYQNCGTKDGSDEGKCRYYAEAQKSTSIFQGPILLALIVSVVAILVFIGVTLVIVLMTRRFNRRSMERLKTAGKRRRPQDYTSTNNLTQNYDPPSYEDAIHTVTDPSLYNITSDESSATDVGHGEGRKLALNFSGTDDKKQKMMLMMMMMKNGHSRGHCCSNSCPKKYRNDHLALTQPKYPTGVNIMQEEKNYCGLDQQPLKVALPPQKPLKDRKSTVNHVHNCSVRIESPVSLSTATYSHRVSNYSNRSSCSSSSNNDFELRPSDEILTVYHDYEQEDDNIVYTNNHFDLNGLNESPRLDEVADDYRENILEGATACCPAVLPPNGLYSGDVSPSFNTEAVIYNSTSDIGSATPNAAIVLNGVVVDDNDDEVEHEDPLDREKCLPNDNNHFSEIDSFLYADGGSGSCSPDDRGVAGSEFGAPYNCQNDSVILRTKLPEPSGGSDKDVRVESNGCNNSIRLSPKLNGASRQCEIRSPESETISLLL